MTSQRIEADLSNVLAGTDLIARTAPRTTTLDDGNDHQQNDEGGQSQCSGEGHELDTANRSFPAA